MKLDEICKQKEWDKSFIEDVLSKTLVRGINQCRFPLFEKGIENLRSVGFKNIWIFKTGSHEYWSQYHGSYDEFFDVHPIGFVGFMEKFQGMSLPDEIEYILCLDNDCFIVDPVDTLEYLYSFVKNDYDLASLSCSDFPQSNTNGDIVIQKNLSEFAEYCVPSGMAYCIFKKDFYYKLEIKKFFNIEARIRREKLDPKKLWPNIKVPNISTLWWAQLGDLNPKFGVHRMGDCEKINLFLMKERRERTFLQYEKGKWIHFWQMLRKYFRFVGNGENLESFNTLSPLDRSYFINYFPERINFISSQEKQSLKGQWNAFLKELT